MLAISIIPGKLAIQRLVKIKVFQNKGYDDLISVHGVTNKVLLSESNYILNVVCDQSLVSLAFL